jgi:ABC-type transport system involved in cytochrome bd biosynthesis fused ATPase/permease subunit
MEHKISSKFYDLLKIGLGKNRYMIFIEPLMLLYIILDSSLGYYSISLSNDIIYNKTMNEIDLLKCVLLLFFPILTDIMNLIFYNFFLKKKLFVVNNILEHIKQLMLYAPNEFHEKFSINEKYNCFTSSIWGFDSIVELLISMFSSLIKILIISISISITNYEFGVLIILSNGFLLYWMPKINTYLEKYNKIGFHKEYYSIAYYNTLIFDENRVNPSLNNLQTPNINYALENIISRFSNMYKFQEILSCIRTCLKNLLLTCIIIAIYYQQKYNYIIMILLNKNIIFGFSDCYENFKKTEHSNKKNMEGLVEMLEFLDEYYKSNIYTNILSTKSIIPQKIQVFDLSYEFCYNKKLVKKLFSPTLIFDFQNSKNIILISGKTGCGKSLFTKILTGQTNCNNYTIYNNGFKLSSFTDLSFNRIIIHQKIAEEYTHNGGLEMNIYNLFPKSNGIHEITQFLQKFQIFNKIENDNLSNKLSGGEKQRVVLASMFWKILKIKPHFIIIDEPEKGIDEETMINILDWFFDCYKGIIFLITHNETIKKKYISKIQSIIKYKFLDNDDINTELFQEFYL